MLTQRLRRNRKIASVRDLVQETQLHPSDFVAPYFVIEGTDTKREIAHFPGVFQWSIDLLIKEAKEIYRLGIPGVALFPAIDPNLKNANGKEALNVNGLLPKAISALKEALPEICIIADIALDPFTSHAHDGIVDDKGNVLNDETVEILAEMAIILGKAGVDMVAPSDMMDGRVRALRNALDENGYKNVNILSYAIKYASAFYGPFREALSSKLSFGDKKSYQMNPANKREAFLEASLDEKEGADILMVKPALLYLDVISELRQKTFLPIAAYQVSGEYAMIKAAASKGWLDEKKGMLEALISIKRAGADMIFSYAAKEICLNL